MEKNYKDGWHVLGGNDVYIENGKIIRATKADINNSEVPAAVYRWDTQYNCYIKEMPITPSAFLSGIKSGKISIK